MIIEIVNQSKFKVTPNMPSLVREVVKELKNRRFRHKKEFFNSSVHKTLTLVFVTQKEMQKINLQFRNKNKPTDVLSFAPISADSFGELVFCVEVLQKQSLEYQHSLDHEFLYMLVHGFFHLLGYDHELSKQEEKLMFRLQDQVYGSLIERLKLGHRYLKI